MCGTKIKVFRGKSVPLNTYVRKQERSQIMA